MTTRPKTPEAKWRRDRYDFHRDTLCYYPGASLVLTQGVASSPDREAILGKVVEFRQTDFTEDNDPYGEHDFGSFEHDGVRYNWKFDDFTDVDPAMWPVREAPIVLTVMRADEY